MGSADVQQVGGVPRPAGTSGSFRILAVPTRRRRADAFALGPNDESRMTDDEWPPSRHRCWAFRPAGLFVNRQSAFVIARSPDEDRTAA